ncbi:hypothetical protein QYF36_013596 [Acer negundo]|nr:hypothetical protein QYF36_013596 [Acer negundo]
MQIMNHQPTKKKLRLGNQTDLEQDRLSNLPETLIYHFLSLLETKDAIQTCVLSKTWRYHWTNIHTLYFDFGNFRRYEPADTDHRVLFREFVLNVLIRRKPFNLHKLKFYCRGSIQFSLVRRVFYCANKHGLEHLETDIVTKFPARDLKTLKLVLCHVNSLTISLDFLKGKFMLYRNTPDAEIKFVELNKIKKWDWIDGDRRGRAAVHFTYDLWFCTRSSGWLIKRNVYGVYVMILRLIMMMMG